MATFEFRCGALPDGTVCIGFDGQEALSKPFDFQVYLTIPASDSLDLKEVLGSKATLTIELGEKTITGVASAPFEYHGIVAEIELLRSTDGNALYRATFVPRLFQLLLTNHSRIWTKKSIKDIVAEVLSEHGLDEGQDVEFRLGGASKPEDHVSQYRESNFAFVSRWMEREGWYYFFDHQDGSDKLVITDNPGAHSSLRSVALRYEPQSGEDGSARDSLSDFSADRRLVSGKVTIRDYDYAKPRLPVSGSSDAGQTGLGEMVHYGARLFAPDEAKRIATVHAEELKARQSTYVGRGAATHLYSGFLFDLDRHARPEMNRTYLLTAVRHIGYQPSLGQSWGNLVKIPKIPNVYRVEIRAIESDLQFRAERLTRWPHIDGFENAVVDGPASSPYAQIDDQGRYNVKFKYDEGTLRDGKASCWVRMAQPHGGTTEGFHFPLRKGTEVIVSFLGGDPDRPLITLAIPNAVTPSKVVSSNHTQNIIQTGSENRIVAEDQSGVEWFHLFSPAGGLNASLYLGTPRAEGGFALTCPDAPAVAETGANAIEYGPYAFQLRTDGNLEIYAGQNINLNAGAGVQMRSQGGDFRTWSSADWYLDVTGDAAEHYENTMHYNVKLKATRTYGADYTLTVDKKVERTYDQTLNTHVDEDATYVFKANHKESVTALHDETIDDGLYELIVGNQITKTKGVHDVTVKTGGQDVVIATNQQRTVSGKDKNETTDANVTWTVGGTFNLNVTGNYNLNAQKEVEVFHGIKFDLVHGLKMDFGFGTFHDKWWGARLAINWTNMLDAAVFRIGATIIDVGLTGIARIRCGADVVAQLIKLEGVPMMKRSELAEFNLAFTIEI